MNEENTDLEHAFFGNVQTILWNYLVKLKRFSVPPMKNKAIRGRARRPEQKQASEQRHFAAAWNFSGRTLYCCGFAAVFAGWRVSVFAAVEPYRTGPFGFPVFAR